VAEQKTKPTAESVTAFLNQLEEKRRADCFALVEIMREAAGAEPKMWGAAAVGFGRYHYRYSSGHEGEFYLVGFSPRKTDLSLHLSCGIPEAEPLFEKLGKHKRGKACVYIKKLADVDTKVLEELIRLSVAKLSPMRVAD
jgi:hypothetical protein